MLLRSHPLAAYPNIQSFWGSPCSLNNRGVGLVLSRRQPVTAQKMGLLAPFYNQINQSNLEFQSLVAVVLAVLAGQI